MTRITPPSQHALLIAAGLSGDANEHYVMW